MFLIEMQIIFVKRFLRSFAIPKVIYSLYGYRYWLAANIALRMIYYASSYICFAARIVKGGFTVI